jgi:hypothetical protein
MTDRTDRTDCPVVELLAIAYHEGGHAVGAVLVCPGLVVESATIDPDEDYQGLVTYEPYDDLIVPDSGEEDGADDEICEHERQYLAAHDTVSRLGAICEGMLRTGNLDEPTTAGWDGDRDNIVWNAYMQTDEDIWRKTGHGQAWVRSPLSSAALALIERTPCFWHAVGLVAGALMREKTLSGADVEALVRAARERS